MGQWARGLNSNMVPYIRGGVMAISMTWPQYRRRQCTHNGKVVQLSRMETEFVSTMLINRGRVLTKYDILDRLYPSRTQPEPGVIGVMLVPIRAKLPGVINAVGYRGYMVEAPQ